MSATPGRSPPSISERMRSCTVELATPGGSSVMTTLRPSTVTVPRTVNDPLPVVT